MNMIANQNNQAHFVIVPPSINRCAVPVDIDGFLIRLIDTAGIRSTDESVEKIGVDKSFEQIQSADLILWLLDRS